MGFAGIKINRGIATQGIKRIAIANPLDRIGAPRLPWIGITGGGTRVIIPTIAIGAKRICTTIQPCQSPAFGTASTSHITRILTGSIITSIGKALRRKRVIRADMGKSRANSAKGVIRIPHCPTKRNAVCPRLLIMLRQVVMTIMLKRSINARIK